MAKGKSQSVADYFDCLMMLGPSSLGLLAASCGACFDGDDDAARLPRESALSRVQRGRSSGGRVEAHREDLPLPVPGRLANAALRVKSLGCCFARADAPKGSKGSKELDSLALSRRFSIRRSQSVTSVTTSVPLLFPLAIASQILLQARCVLQRCNRLIAGATSVSAWQSSRCSITTC